MSVTVLLSSYNQGATLKLALEALMRQTESPGEVIVSDDGSTDGTVEWLDEMPDDQFPFPVRYVTVKHCGYDVARAYNAGLGRAIGNRILFSNADVLLSPDSVRLHGQLDEDRLGGGQVLEIAMPFSQAVTLVDVMMFERVVSTFQAHAGGYGNSAWMSYRPELNPCGFWCGNMSVPMKWYERVRGFDRGYSFKYGGEEPDLVERCLKAGAHASWVSNSIGYHLQHPRREYTKKQLGVVKYRQERGIA